MEQPQIEWRLPTRLVRGGLTRSPHSETSEALYLTSGYVYDTAEEAAAVFAALASILKAGDRLVASRALFGSCLHVVAKILPSFRIETRLVDGTDIGQWRDALKGGARAVFLETPSNPTLEIIDLPEVCSVVDNVFASPLLQKPWKSAPTSSSTPPRSASTARAAASVVRCRAHRNSWTGRSSPSSGTPAPHSLPSMRGCC